MTIDLIMSFLSNLYLKLSSSRSFIIYPLILIIFLVAIHAWFCDDSFFTLRPALNFHYSYGPVWNPGERVQSFTNPLWMFILSFSDARNIFNFAFLVSLFLVIGQLLLIINISRNFFTAVLLFLLSSSSTFIDFGTSGLETPLSGFLVALSYYFARNIKLNSRLRIVSIIAGLSYLSRPDLLIINFLDPNLRIILDNQLEIKRRFNRILIFVSNTMFILSLWFIFSTLYYGFPFPVTAYAKLGIDISRFSIVYKGIGFFTSFLISDLSAVTILITALVIPIKRFLDISNKIKNLYLLRVPIIILLNISYTIFIGGDFFLGRFYYPLLIYGTLSLVEFEENKVNLSFKKYSIIIFSIVILISPFYNGQISKLWLISKVSKSLNYPLTPFYYHTDKRNSDKEKRDNFCTLGACDQKNALLHRFTFSQNRELNEISRKVSNEYKSTNEINLSSMQILGSGYSGYSHGPKYLAYDDQGLTDLLQARMPYIKGTKWYAAHFIKFFPRANDLRYFLTNDDNFIKIYNSLNLISRDEIFSIERLKEIFKQNFGFYRYRYEMINKRYGSLTKQNCEFSNRVKQCKSSLNDK